jgi:hypothetical protein
VPLHSIKERHIKLITSGVSEVQKDAGVAKNERRKEVERVSAELKSTQEHEESAWL